MTRYEAVERNENTKDVEILHLNTLPTIIDGPGKYVMRNGQRATIHEVSDTARSIEEGTTLMAAKGNAWRMFRGKMRPRDFSIWHVSGRHLPHEESPKDIVGVCQESGTR